jgi:hypothetical protein
MPVLFQTLSIVVTILQIVLAPLLIGLVVALASASMRRTIIAAAITAAALVFVDVVLVDAISGLRGQIAYYQSPTYSQPGAVTLTLSEVLLSVGLSFNFAAVILGLRETARLRRWGWFFAFLLTQLAAAIGTALFTLTYIGIAYTNTLFLRLYRGDAAISVPYYLLTSLLLIIVPLATLLFAIIGIPSTESANPLRPAQPAPMPPVAPPTTPYRPYPPQQ